MKNRYVLICVAPEMPYGGMFDDPDEAIVNCGANYDVYDRVTEGYLTPTCQEDVDDALERLKAKREEES